MTQLAIFTIGAMLGMFFGAATVAALAVCNKADEINRNRGE